MSHTGAVTSLRLLTSDLRMIPPEVHLLPVRADGSAETTQADCRGGLTATPNRSHPDRVPFPPGLPLMASPTCKSQQGKGTLVNTVRIMNLWRTERGEGWRVDGGGFLLIQHGQEHRKGEVATEESTVPSGSPRSCCRPRP